MRPCATSLKMTRRHSTSGFSSMYSVQARGMRPREVRTQEYCMKGRCPEPDTRPCLFNQPTFTQQRAEIIGECHSSHVWPPTRRPRTSIWWPGGHLSIWTCKLPCAYAVGSRETTSSATSVSCFHPSPTSPAVKGQTGWCKSGGGGNILVCCVSHSTICKAVCTCQLCTHVGKGVGAKVWFLLIDAQTGVFQENLFFSFFFKWFKKKY